MKGIMSFFTVVGCALLLLGTTFGGVVIWSQTDSADLNHAAVEIIIDGGGSAISTGIVNDVELNFDFEISQATMLCDQTGSIVVDIWMEDYANFPPTNADSITDAGTSLTISAAIKTQDSVLTNWTTTLVEGEFLRFNVDPGVATVERCLVSLTGLKL